MYVNISKYTYISLQLRSQNNDTLVAISTPHTPILIFFFKDFIYLWAGSREGEDSASEHVHKQGEPKAEGEIHSLMKKKPNVGSDPRTHGSRPELKTDATQASLKS